MRYKPWQLLERLHLKAAAHFTAVTAPFKLDRPHTRPHSRNKIFLTIINKDAVLRPALQPPQQQLVNSPIRLTQPYIAADDDFLEVLG